MPSSQTSPLYSETMPSPQYGNLHFSVQTMPLAFSTSPISHSSPFALLTYPSPQRGNLQSGVHSLPLAFSVLPKSQSSPGSAFPLPQLDPTIVHSLLQFLSSTNSRPYCLQISLYLASLQRKPVSHISPGSTMPLPHVLRGSLFFPTFLQVFGSHDINV